MPEHEQTPRTGRTDRIPVDEAERRDGLILEKDIPLSRSLLWRRQREYYERRGMRAWSEDDVPSYITSNPFFAEAYARMVLAYLRDCLSARPGGQPAVSDKAPLCILELGAGSGKFAYLFLRRLGEMLREGGLAPAMVRYCMTDRSEKLIGEWRENSRLRELAERGMLEFAAFSAGDEENVRVRVRGPLVVIANYVFDSLPQDVFVTRNGQLFEALVTTTETGGSAGGAGSQPRVAFQNVATPRERYEDPRWNAILEAYRTRLPDATVLFPTGALQTLEALGKSAEGRMLALVADKGVAHEDELRHCQGPATFEWHAASQCFSLGVNFDALAKHFAASGGQALLPEKRSTNLKTCAFLLGYEGEGHPATVAAYREVQSGFGADDLFALFAWLNAHMEEMAAPQVLAALRLSCWDPMVLLRLFPVLARQLRGATRERQDLREAIQRTWENHYPIQAEEKALAFKCGVVLLELGFFAEAQRMFKRSQQELGPSASTSYNLALCAQGLGRASEALAHAAEACRLEPGSEAAQSLRKKLEAAGAEKG
ncbi:MAG TPA: SAM-dependent methyltransferase [Methylomirabilota bacterium]|nr:SAM-dependent methyltransferase [Methylomirabilota bacterium]